MSTKKVLVTGGAGFIGSHLVDLLMSEGCHVRVVDSLINGKLENLKQHEGSANFEFVKADIRDASTFASAVENAEVVFHLACLGVRHSIKYPHENQRVNAEGSFIVLNEAHKAGVEKFIYCSSSEVYGTAEYVPMPEEHPTRPCTVYGAGKLAGEAYARAFQRTYGLNTVVLRLFNTYGPRSHHENDIGELIPKSIVRALNGKPVLIFGNGSQTRDFTYVEDSAKALLEAARCDNAAGKTLNAGSEFEITIEQVAKLILNITKSASSIEYYKNRPGDVLRLYSDTSAFRKLTNWKPQVSLKEGLARTMKWFKSRPEGPSFLLSQEKPINWE
ncbi:MAG: SDR family NAD(P)-dependent oxidoreductase [Candidatus Omnitrophica bacterium]|nr:SDR family NAD(P)-dependent oxidoreductase [Candidatus Omnitrophota bacterium]